MGSWEVDFTTIRKKINFWKPLELTSVEFD